VVKLLDPEAALLFPACDFASEADGQDQDRWAGARQKNVFGYYLVDTSERRLGPTSASNGLWPFVAFQFLSVEPLVLRKGRREKKRMKRRTFAAAPKTKQLLT
jgi:hypothetical protein